MVRSNKDLCINYACCFKYFQFSTVLFILKYWCPSFKGISDYLSNPCVTLTYRPLLKAIFVYIIQKWNMPGNDAIRLVSLIGYVSNADFWFVGYPSVQIPRPPNGSWPSCGNCLYATNDVKMSYFFLQTCVSLMYAVPNIFNSQQSVIFILKYKCPTHILLIKLEVYVIVCRRHDNMTWAAIIPKVVKNNEQQDNN